MIDRVLTAFNEAIFDTDRQRALRVIHQAEQDGILPEDIVFKVVVPSIHIMMKSTSERRTPSIAQHFVAAQIASEVTESMVARFARSPEIIGRVVIGTSVGDMHGLGKRIVSGCLKALMIEVIDLGLNVPAERFVEEAIAHNADVIGVSSMMVHTARGPSAASGVRKILKDRALEQRIKLAVGGAPYRFDHELYRTVGADAWAEDGIVAGTVISALIKEVRQ
jgi:methanogenic corrinoid protein MtbC1